MSLYIGVYLSPPRAFYLSISTKVIKLRNDVSMRTKPIMWSEEELTLLKDNYSTSTKEKLLELFPNRSYKSICGKAERLGMKKVGRLSVRYWTDEEVDIVKEFYSSEDEEFFKETLPSRTWSEIQNKASKLKIRKYKMNENHVRRENVTLNTFEEISEALSLYGHTLIDFYRLDGVKHVDIITNRGLKRRFRLNKIMEYGENIPYSPKNPKYTYSEAKEYIESFDYKLLTKENEYRTTNTMLQLECDKGHKWKNNFNTFLKGVRCEKCFHEKPQSTMTTIEDIERHMLNKDIKLVRVIEYKGLSSTVEYQCINNESHDIETDVVTNIYQRQYGCVACYFDKIRGENSPVWQGGITSLTRWARGRIDEWRKDSLKFHNYKCMISGSSENLIIHHIYPFHLILKETLKELDLPVKVTISEYTEDELISIKDLMLKKHYDYGIGACLTEELHNQFHSKYSRHYFTEEDFYEFLKLNNNEKESIAN